MERDGMEWRDSMKWQSINLQNEWNGNMRNGAVQGFWCREIQRERESKERDVPCFGGSITKCRLDYGENVLFKEGDEFTADILAD